MNLISEMLIFCLSLVHANGTCFALFDDEFIYLLA